MLKKTMVSASLAAGLGLFAPSISVDSISDASHNASTTSFMASVMSSAVHAADNKSQQSGPAYLQRKPEDEVIYFMLPDRFENGDKSNDTGGIKGGRLDHGFDPTHKGFYQGGDLKGLTARLDYIQDMGATAIWLGPIYKNKAVQGGDGQESSGYHGYWITDFTTVDPHLGTEEDLKTFIDSAHDRGIKVYLDIITNHTADVIQYRECHDPNYSGADKETNGCPYRSLADYPYTTKGKANGKATNQGFMGDSGEHQHYRNFAKLTDPNYAYTPFVPDAEKNVKVPAWLNDPKFYHNRGDTTFRGENSRYGDFVGLDDLMTEHPQVIEGFIDIFKDWISKYKVDGFRIDTARHVNPEFWQAFVPAMIDHAKLEGIPNFFIFGEVYEHNPAELAIFTHRDLFPALLDFSMQSASERLLINKENPEFLMKLFEADILYKGGFDTAKTLPTFVSNHDHGRFAGHAMRRLPDASLDEIYKRTRLAHALLFFSRGTPVIYSGDEQGFTGDGGDEDARETLFPSQVAVYNDNTLLKTDATTADENFDRKHPMYKSLKNMAKAYNSHKGLRSGKQVTRLTDLESGGLFAISRIDDKGNDYLIVFNSGQEDQTRHVAIDSHLQSFSSVIGKCNSKPTAPGSYEITVKALDYIVCKGK